VRGVTASGPSGAHTRMDRRRRAARVAKLDGGGDGKKRSRRSLFSSCSRRTAGTRTRVFN